MRCEEFEVNCRMNSVGGELPSNSARINRRGAQNGLIV